MELDLKAKEPYYLQIREVIRDKIEKGIWVEGTLIPSEKELANMFNVSRVTIRKAISELVEQQYLIRTAGFGTVVYQNRKGLSNFTLVRSFTKEMNAMGIPTHTIDIKLELIIADDNLARIFNMKQGDKLYQLQRVRGDSIPIYFSNTYLVPVMKMPKDIAPLKDSLYKYLSDQSIYFNRFYEVISSVQGTKEIREKLNVSDEAPLLKRVRYSYDDKNSLIEYTETYYNALLYEYRTEIQYRR